MPPKAKAAAAKKPRATKSQQHVLAVEFPAGEVLTDQMKKQWRLGKAVGAGGFGLIYLASPSDNPKKEEYVIKVEPHDNGPLFCELNFYQRVAKPQFIADWMSSHKKKVLGIPKLIAFGSHERKGTRYRFMVMERFGSDLQKIFEQNGKVFPVKAVLQLGYSLVDCLEYVHSKGYAHADIKAANLLMGYTKQTQNQVFLVDYGLAFRFSVDGTHKEYKEDPRKAHDGTVEFTSRDAHNGVVPSRRADFEILAYCMVQWLCGQLPWERTGKLEDKPYVAAQKNKYMNNIPEFMKVCFPSQKPPGGLVDYLKYVVEMEYDDEPDYNYLRGLFTQALKTLGCKVDDRLELDTKPATTKGPGSSKRKSDVKPRRQQKDSVSDSDSPEVVSPQPRKRTKPGPSKASEDKPATPKMPVSGKVNGHNGIMPAHNGIIPAHNGIMPTMWTPGKKADKPASKITGNSIIPGHVKEESTKGSSTSSPVPVRGRSSPATRKKATKTSAKENGYLSPVETGRVGKAKDKKTIKLSALDVSTQTSPGLKGLPRSWKKTSK